MIIVDIAAEYGHLHIVKWCEEFNLSPTKDSLRIAILNGHEHIEDYAKLHNLII